MIQKDNMDLFNTLTLQLLIRLHDSFPVKQDIMIEEYSDLHNSEHSKVFYDTVNFLKDEDFIQYSDQMYGGFASVSLKIKGLNLLNSTPLSISKTESLIQVFKKAFKNGSLESYNMAVKELIKAALTTTISKISNE